MKLKKRSGTRTAWARLKESPEDVGQTHQKQLKGEKIETNRKKPRDDDQENTHEKKMANIVPKHSRKRTAAIKDNAEEQEEGERTEQRPGEKL